MILPFPCYVVDVICSAFTLWREEQKGSDGLIDLTWWIMTFMYFHVDVTAHTNKEYNLIVDAYNTNIYFRPSLHVMRK